MGRQKGEGEGEVRSSSRSSRGVPPEEARCARREGEEAEEAEETMAGRPVQRE